MNEGWYWCRFGRHEFSTKTLGGRSAGVELVRGVNAASSSKGREAT